MDGQGTERLGTSWRRERTRDVREGLGLPAQLGCVSRARSSVSGSAGGGRLQTCPFSQARAESALERGRHCSLLQLYILGCLS